MKKLMFAMVAVALATVANAAASYNYTTLAYVSPYGQEVGRDKSKYVFYAMTQTTAQNLLGVQSTVTYLDVATWAKNNGYRPSINALNDLAQNAGNSTYRSDWGLYTFEQSGTVKLEGDDLSKSIGIVLYNDGNGTYAFNTYSRAREGYGSLNTTFYFDVDCESPSSVSGWTETASIPEPTSGILLILGVAGLALKRKQK